MPQAARTLGSLKPRKNYDKNRKTAHQRGYTAKWQRARLAHLKKNPLCVECMKHNKVKQAEVVDHIIPHKGDMALFWDVNNWQSLCTTHHNIKTGKGL